MNEVLSQDELFAFIRRTFDAWVCEELDLNDIPQADRAAEYECRMEQCISEFRDEYNSRFA